MATHTSVRCIGASWRAPRLRTACGLSAICFVAAGCAPGGGGAGRHDVPQADGAAGFGGTDSTDPSATNGGPILRLATCGNSVIDSGEDCDDGNTNSGDGCNRVCQIESDYVCTAPGQACVYSAVCGDGTLASNESCDDGNTVSGDGCAADCRAVDPGWLCRAAGKRCVPLCGDKVLTAPETCDDGNANGGDGCSSGCLTEPGWSCTPSGCVQSICGNGTKDAEEACDQGKLNGLFYGDSTGCSKTCTLEPSCRDATGKTTACSTACGDANVDPGEGCDDGNRVSGDGCSSTCMVEAGFTCTGQSSKDTGTCKSGTGECLELPITFRDFDGQQAPTGHPDFFFLGATVGGKKTVCVPNASGKAVALTSACASTDSTDLCSGLVDTSLGADGKPTLNAAKGATCQCRFTDWDQTGVLASGMPNVTQCNVTGDGSKRFRIEQPVQVIQSVDTFKQWYSDSTFSTKVLGTLELSQVAGTNQYRFSSGGDRTVYDDLHDLFLRERGATTGVTSLSSGFFPLEDQPRTKVCNIWPYWKFASGAACSAGKGLPVPSQWDPEGWYGSNLMPPMMISGGPAGTIMPVTGVARNFYFTSQVRYLFHYVGGETLAFYGDDDVWVFINGRLVFDLGAPHERLQGSVSLSSAGATWAIQSQDVLTRAVTPIANGTVTGLGLNVGSTYEIAVFHADRHPRESNYQLTVSGFSTSRSTCQPTCGDGVATVSEECDDGPANQDSVYGGCTSNCKLGPFCGDGQKNGPEQCDLGRGNGATYGSKDGCTAACTTPRYCGDGNLDTAFGEQCDEGQANGGSVCSSACELVVR